MKDTITLGTTENITVIKINEVTVFIEEIGVNCGKLTISGYDHNYSYYWGAMGGTLKQFILSMNDDYFTSKLLGIRNSVCFDVNNTFAELRKYIREELNLPYYKHMKFQKHLREKLREFQNNCQESGEQYFVDRFSLYLDTLLPFYEIDDRWDAKSIEEDFKSLCSEPWHFIQQKENQESKWLRAFHKKLKKAIKTIK